MKTFILSESDIQSIINGRDVIKQDGNSKILIRQSYVKDMLPRLLKIDLLLANQILRIASELQTIILSIHYLESEKLWYLEIQ